MQKYSYRTSQRRKTVNKIMDALIRFHFNHQNIILLILGIILAYLLFQSEMLYGLIESLSRFGYPSAFILGFLFSFGSLTAPSAAALFILAKSFNPVIIALVAATAAAISNFLIFRFVKEELFEEVKFVLSRELRFDVSNIEHKINRTIFKSKFLQSAIPALSGILTSLPLPTEMLVSVLWTIARYDTKKVLFYSFIFSFVGILNIAIFSHAVS